MRREQGAVVQMGYEHNFDEVIDRRGTDSQMHQLYPSDVLPMHLAETDFKTAQPISDAIAARAAQGAFGYVAESESFQSAVKHWMDTRFAWSIEQEWVEYAPSVGASLLHAIQAFTHPGDRVLIQTPVYHAFHSLIDNSGRIKAFNPLLLKQGRYEVDFDDLERQLSHPRTKLMLLCHPHNPLGRVWSLQELARIAELCLHHGVFLVSDEVHSDLVFAGHPHIPLPKISKQIADNCIVCINPSKTFNLAGLRTAAVIIPNERVREAFRISLINNKALDRPVFGVLGLETAYRQCASYVDQLVPYIEGNVSLLSRYLTERMPQLELIKPEATYLMWLDGRKLSIPLDKLAAFFEQEAKLGLRDGAVFGNGDGFLRMNIAFPRAVLERALSRMEQAISKM